MKFVRRTLAWLIRILLVVLILVLAAYLGRRPLFEDLIREVAAEELASVLGAEAVEIGPIGGNWVTTLELGPVAIRGGDGVRSVENARIRAWLAPWRFVSGDLSGLVRVDVRADEVDIDLGGFAGSDEPVEESTGETDWRTYLDLLPAGGQVEVDRLTLRQGERVRSGPVRARIAPRSERRGHEHSVRLELPDLVAEVEVDEAGVLRGDLQAERTADWIGLFADADGYDGGALRGRVRLQLGGEWQGTASLALRDALLMDRRVDRLELDVALDAARIEDLNVRLFAEGVRVDGQGLSCEIAEWKEAVRSLRGELHASVSDTKPYSDLFPAELAAFDPRLGAEVRLIGSQLQLSRLQVTAGEDRIGISGVVDLAVTDEFALAQGTSLDFEASVGDVGLWLGAFGSEGIRGPLKATGGWQPFGSPQTMLELETDLEFDQRSPLSIAATVEGRGLAMPWDHLVIQGVVSGELSLLGDIERVDGEIRIAKLEAKTEGGSLELHGRIGTDDPAGAWDAMQRDASIEGTWRAPDLSVWLGLAGIQDVGGEFAGDLAWTAAGAPEVSVDLDGVVQGLGERAIELTAKVRGDGTGLRVTELLAGHELGKATGSATVQLPFADLLGNPDAVPTATLAGRFDFTEFDLGSLPTESLGLADLGGILGGYLELGGSLAEPEPRLQLKIDGGYLRVPKGPRIEALSGGLAVLPREVRIDDLRGEIGAGPFSLKGTFVAPDLLVSAWRDGVVDFAIRGTDVLIHRRDGLKLRGDLDLTAKGPVSNVVVGGLIELHSGKLVGRIPYLSVRQQGGAAARSGIVIEGPELPPPLHVELDVTVRSRDPIAVKTNVLTGGITAALQLRGPLELPALEGTLSGSESQVALPGCKFRASTLLVRFERTDPHFPTINVIGRGRRHGYDVQMVVRGRYDQPEVLFSSNPPLGADELAVLVTTGARPETLRNQGARGVGTTLGVYLAEELADYIFGSESTEAKESFLDRFTVETGTEISSNSAESIVVEFRFLDQFYLQGERDVYEDINFGVVYRLRFR